MIAAIITSCIVAAVSLAVGIWLGWSRMPSQAAHLAARLLLNGHPQSALYVLAAYLPDSDWTAALVQAARYERQATTHSTETGADQ